jgi:S1-C subfamily serine protease
MVAQGGEGPQPAAQALEKLREADGIFLKGDEIAGEQDEVGFLAHSSLDRGAEIGTEDVFRRDADRVPLSHAHFHVPHLFGLPERKGFLVERLEPWGLAERAGIRAGSRMVLLNETVYVLGGDIVTAINGEDVSSESQIARILLRSRPGETLTVRLFREGQVHEVALPLEAMHSR